ncbi:MAG: acetyl-CoA carboxylase biotin carboxyl carrier protein [Phaeodactylibacter sp.]|nr:acetyl-CoA carboxylase biotin carboxyl carrier protein [Phaeodactylibacter sp.]MCB9275737.1 acetyl-CoA carboxylase biotin carboxyl carrier protein [Lewinellaceae bacterium]
MTFKEIQELIKLISRTNLTEFKVKDGEFELSLRTDKYEKHKQQVPAPPPAAAAQPAPFIQMPAVQPPYPAAPAATQAPQPAAQAPAPESKAEAGDGDAAKYREVKSPIVGTFYRSSSPEKPPYVKVGDVIESGQVVCIVEAMKLFNEIESEISGKIVKVMVEDAQPVEYDQVLFLVDPKG